MTHNFTTKERKKEFDLVFKGTIIPLFNKEGFSRHTKNSKRMLKEFDNDLSVCIFFEYKNRFGSYDITIAYFDEEIGNIMDDGYLVIANVRTSSIDGENKEKLTISLERWIEEMQSSIFPFIEKHSNHKTILESDQFYISKAREEIILEVLNRKALK